MKTELEQIEKMAPAKLFKPKFMPTLLKAIEIEATAEIPDVETADGRKAITSLAYKIARSKTTIDDLGKGFVAEQKSAIAAVDAVRKCARDFLDNLKLQVRKPLTDWEDAEEIRIEKITDKINLIRALGNPKDEANLVFLAPEFLTSNLERLRAMKITKTFAEYQDEAINAKNEAIVKLIDAIPLAEAREQEAENARLFAEQQAEDQRIEEEQRIAREAVEAADLESTKELNRIQQEAANQEIIDKDERLQREARESDVKHRRGINREALESMLKVNPSCDEVLAKQIIKSIAAGKIDNITINY
jgi:hypothetical protein